MNLCRTSLLACGMFQVPCAQRIRKMELCFSTWRKGLCYSLNVVAAKVWNTLEECQPGIAFVKLVDTMRERFDVPREQLETDTAEHLQTLEKMGLAPPTSPSLPSPAY